MADNKIVHRISLEGADKVSKQLQSIGLEGENAFKKVKQSAEGLSLDKIGEGGTRKLEESREAAERFREVLHTLHPILGAAGLEIGNLGAFARLAGAGMGALGVAIVGSVLIGLAKLGDEADKAKRRLDLLSGAGKGGGESQFEGLKKTARELGVDSSDLAPAAETLFRSQQNSRAADRNVIHPDNFVPGANEDAANRVQVFRGGEGTPSAGLSSETINAAIKASAEAGRLDRTSPKDSTAALVNLYESTKGGKGQITVDAYDALVKASPAIGDAIAKAASGSAAGGVGQALPAGAPDLRAFLQRGGKLTGDQVLTGLARTEPDLRKRAEAVPPGTTESFEHLEASAKNLAEAFSKLAGSKLFSGPLDAVSKGIDKAADLVEHNAEKIKDSATRGYEIGSKTHIPGAGVAGGIIGADVGALKNIGGDILKETKEQFEAAPLGQFLTKAATDPGALPGNTPEQQPLSKPSLTREQLAKTVIPSPLEAFSKKSEQESPSAAAHEATSDAAIGKVPPLQSIPTPEVETKPVENRSEERSPPAPKSPEVGRAGIFDGGPFSKNPNDVIDDRNTRHRSDAGDAAPQPQQVADLSSIVRDILISVTAAANNVKGPQDNKVTGPVDAIGIRGEAAPAADDTAKKQVADLGTAAEEAAAKLRGVEAPTSAAAPVAHAAAGGSIVRMAEGGRLDVSPGGHLQGPGTGKSDSIDAKVANGEFVVNAKDTAKNIELLHDINSGKDVGHYADGGEVQKPAAKPNAPDLKGNFSVVYDPNTGGAYINGGLHVPGDPILSVPEIAQAIARSKADMKDTKSNKSNDEFNHNAGGYGGSAAYGAAGKAGGYAEGGLVGRFAEGGSVSRGSSASTFAARINAMGLSSIDVPHFAVGGMPDIPSPDLSKSDLQTAGSKEDDAKGHYTVDLRTNHGDFSMMAPEDVAKKMSAAARDSSNAQTGPRPSWYRGR